MAWIENITWRYNREVRNSSVLMFKYKNDGSTVEYMSTVGVLLGTGNATYTHGDTLTGTGKSFTVYAYCTGSDSVKSTSQTVTVDNPVGRTKEASSGLYYPTKDDTERYTFKFDHPVKVNAGATVNIYLKFTSSSSDTVIVYWGSSGDLTGVVNDLGVPVKIYTSNGWVNAIPYVYSGGWKVAIPYVFRADQWRPCRS